MSITRNSGDHRYSFQDPRSDNNAILVLVDDDGCRDLILDGLDTASPVTVTRTTA